MTKAQKMIKLRYTAWCFNNLINKQKTMFKHGEKKCCCSMVGHALIIIGALNWGLVGLGGFMGKDLNVISLIFGSVSWLENAIYVLVGISAIMMLAGCKCKKCDEKNCCKPEAKGEENK